MKNMDNEVNVDYTKGVQDEHETIQDRLPRDIDNANCVMSLKDEYGESKLLKHVLKYY